MGGSYESEAPGGHQIGERKVLAGPLRLRGRLCICLLLEQHAGPPRTRVSQSDGETVWQGSALVHAVAYRGPPVSLQPCFFQPRNPLLHRIERALAAHTLSSLLPRSHKTLEPNLGLGFRVWGSKVIAILLIISYL